MAKLKSQVPALPAPKKKKQSDETFNVSAVDDEKKRKKRREASRAAALYEEEHPPKKKKKRVDDDDEPKRKKRTELQVYDEDDEPKLSKLKGKALRTQFGSGAEKILRLLEKDETDPAVALIYKRLLQSVVDVLPLAEMGIRASKGVRGIHGFNMLISSLRELMVDVQSAQDRGMMGQTLVMSVLQPAFTDLAQEMVQEFSILAADLKSQLSEEDHAKALTLLKETRGRIANRMTHHYHVMRDGTVAFLQR
jgi:hypothetical protein